MPAKLMSLAFLCAALAFPQERGDEYTLNMSNGRSWRETPEIAKIGYIVAVWDMATWIEIRDGRGGHELEKDTARLSHLAATEVVQEVDKFYSDPSNALVPILETLSWVDAKASGASPAELDSLEATLRRRAIRFKEIEGHKN
ncbi:MAG: hypothetical protein WA213_15230 [Terriglobales bacterium]